MVKRPVEFNPFEFVVMSAQRAAQLLRGCVPLVPVDSHKVVTTAQMEVATYRVQRSPPAPAATIAETTEVAQGES